MALSSIEQKVSLDQATTITIDSEEPEPEEEEEEEERQLVELHPTSSTITTIPTKMVAIKSTRRKNKTPPLPVELIRPPISIISAEEVVASKEII